MSSIPRISSAHETINLLLPSFSFSGFQVILTFWGNGLADRALKEATTITKNTMSLVSLLSSLQVINEKICDSLLTHNQIA